MTFRRLRSWLIFAPVWLACNGTSTGNPMNEPNPGKVPEGAKLVKSELARVADPALSAQDAATLGLGNRAFAFDLYRAQAQTEAGNLFLSPLSVSVALAMTYPGARGQTETEIKEALHFDLPQPLLHTAFNATLRALGGRGAELKEKST